MHVLFLEKKKRLQDLTLRYPMTILTLFVPEVINFAKKKGKKVQISM